MKIETVKMVPLSNVIPAGYEWIYEYLADSKTLTWGDANHTLIELAWFREEVDEAAIRAAQHGNVNVDGIEDLLDRLPEDIFIDLEN